MAKQAVRRFKKPHPMKMNRAKQNHLAKTINDHALRYFLLALAFLYDKHLPVTDHELREALGVNSVWDPAWLYCWGVLTIETHPYIELQGVRWGLTDYGRQAVKDSHEAVVAGEPAVEFDLPR